MWATGPPKYYRPYESDEESDAESEVSSEYTDSDTASEGPNFRTFASHLALTAGPSLSTTQAQLEYDHGQVNRNLYYYPYQATQETPDQSLLKEYGETKFVTDSRETTSLVLIDSLNRDRQVYTQPSFFTLRLPRIYKYVTNVQLTQIKLLCSFYYFRPDKNNTTVALQEYGRIQTGTLSNPATFTATIRTGTYSISALLTELNNQLNRTPLFYDYPNGFSDFNTKFQTNGFFGLNFNEPGDNYYDPISDSFTNAPTKTYIINRFWKTLYGGQLTYTTTQSKVAYYYPPLKWAFINSNTSFLNLTSALTIDSNVQTLADLSNRVLYTFTGINDPVIQELIRANTSANLSNSPLDSYRLSNTFRYYPINKYVVALEPQSQFITISEPSLNTSLLNLLGIQSSNYLINALNQYGISLATYCNTVIQINRLNAILQQMYSFNQTQFLNYFAVPYTQYSIDYYAHLDWTILLRNGIGVTSLPTNIAEAEAAGIQTITANILEAQRNDPIHYWPRYQSNIGVPNTVTNTAYITNLSNADFSNLNHPYNIPTKSFIEKNFNVPVYFIDPVSHTIYSDATKTGNCIVPINASKYSVFKFHSPVRQTIQVETLQRPLDYRVPEYNLINYGSTIIENFNDDYSFVPYSNMPYANPVTEFKTLFDNLFDSKLIYIPGWQSSNPSWGLSLSQTRDIWQSFGACNLDINATNKSLYFYFTTPPFSNATPGCNYRYTLNVNLLLGNDSNVTSNYTPVLPTNDIRILFYGDRGAFQADVLCNRNESPFNYKTSTIITTAISSTTVSFDVFPEQEYYIIARPDSPSFGQVFMSVSPYFATVPPRYDTLNSDVASLNPATDVLSPSFSYISSFQYAKIYDPAYIHLPIQSTLWGPNPSASESTRTLDVSGVPLGYDTNDVSSDYTDYIPYTPNSEFFTFDPNRNKTGLDPTNKYQFQKNSPYSISTETYIYTNSDNIILTPGLKLIYNLSNIPKRQQKISHYYSLTYLMDQSYANLFNTIIYSNEAQQPFTIKTTYDQRIRGYDYAPSSDPTQQYLTLGKGVIGFSFLPEDGVWDFDSAVFRSAINDSNQDPNRSITYLGVYNTQTISAKNLNEISLSDAILCLSSFKINTYVSSSTSVFDSGFDAKGGTYYEFRKYDGFIPKGVSTITGLNQKEGQMINAPDKLYSLIAFDVNSNVTYMRALSGSLVPYPLYNNVQLSSNYIDSNFPPNLKYNLIYPTGSNQTYYSFADNLWSNFAPPAGYDSGTQSVFEQSMPIGTSVVHYNDFNNFTENSNSLEPWTTPFLYNQLVTTVSGYMLMADVNASVFSYGSNTLPREITNQSNLHWYITADVLVSAYDNQQLIGLTGNSTDFIVYGAREASPTTLEILISKASPSTRIISAHNLTTPLYVDKGGTFGQFFYRDTGDYIFTYRTESNATIVYWSIGSGQSNCSYVIPDSLHINMTSDPTGGPIYYIPIHTESNIGSNVFYSVDISQVNGFQKALQFNILSADVASPATYNQIAMNYLNNPYDEELTFLTNEALYSSNIFGMISWNIDAGEAYVAKYAFVPKNAQNIPLKPITIQGGTGGSSWLTTNGTPQLWGNRNTPVDIDNIVGSAWQIFYPFQKLSLVKVANATTSITDMTGIDYPEYPHTQLFYYSNTQNFCNDTQYKWGQESKSNFTVGSVNFNGYYFNSYIFNVPARPSSNGDYQYITVRNYTPTEKSQVMMRFYSPGEYDFGYVSFLDMFNEIYLAQQNAPDFSVQYSEVIQAFDSNYAISNVAWGSGALQDYGGSTIKFTGFSSFLTTYSTIYSQYTESSRAVSSINATVQSNIQAFINSQLSNFLPSNALNRQNYTDSIPTSFLWKSALLPQYKNLLDNWGLGYNLGFAKRDTPYSTFIRADSFYKILDEYIYLRLNPEYRLNALDITANEDFSITRDPTGVIQNYHAKILLNSFGNYTQTAVIVPARLNPPLPRLDQMSFELTDVTGTRLNNLYCEWNATLQVVEQTNTATTTSVLPRLV